MARSPSHTPTELGALNEHIVALEKTSKLLLAEQLDLERAGTVPEPPRAGETPIERRHRWMNGYAPAPLTTAPNNAARLHEIILDRDAIQSAVSSLEVERIKLHAERDRDAAADLLPEFRERFQAKWDGLAAAKSFDIWWASLSSGVRMNLPLAPVIGLKPTLPWGNDPLGELRRAAVKAGIISAKECER